MATYAYHALDSVAREVRGTIAADSPREARDKLRQQGLLVEAIAQQDLASSKRRLRFRRSGAYGTQLAMAIRDLATLMGTGIGLVEALDTISAQSKGRLRESLLSVRQRVASGLNLSDAMEADSVIYDELTIQMVRVGENAGTLEATLDQLADFRERYLLFKDRITTALIYPAIVVGLAGIVSIFLMTVILPMLLENLVDSGRPLPWPTRVLKSISDLAVGRGLWILLGSLALGSGLLAALKTTVGRRLWHRAYFKLPVLGQLAKKQEIARVALIIATLMKNGIVFVEAVQIAGRATKNLLLRDALDTMRRRVQTGTDIGEALVVGDMFPPLVIQIFTVGQQTGALETMLDRLAGSYERQVASATSRLTAAMEPILIVFLAIVVGFILFATILPILEAGNVL